MLLALATPPGASAQAVSASPRGATAQAVSATTLKAVFLDRFARFVEWPESAGMADPSTPFVISILGDGEFGDVVESVYGARKIRNKEVRVRRISSVSEIGSPHMLYVGKSEANHLAEIVKAVHGEPILTVADTKGFGEKGVQINFVILDGKLGFDVNQAELEASPLKVSYMLLRAAHNVGGAQ